MTLLQMLTSAWSFIVYNLPNKVDFFPLMFMPQTLSLSGLDVIISVLFELTLCSTILDIQKISQVFYPFLSQFNPCSY